jgi:hypothetical protein
VEFVEEAFLLQSSLGPVFVPELRGKSTI